MNATKALLQIPSRRLLAVLGAAALALSLTSSGVHAQISACRSDPLVTLSNGDQITLYEDISDTATDVTKITYQLHIPVGLSVKAITYSGAIASKLQTISVTPDENIGNYDAYTVVFTKTPNIPVTAYMTANTTTSTQTAGHSGQTLHSHVHV
jgi:hypothetical protein